MRPKVKAAWIAKGKWCQVLKPLLSGIRIDSEARVMVSMKSDDEWLYLWWKVRQDLKPRNKPGQRAAFLPPSWYSEELGLYSWANPQYPLPWEVPSTTIPSLSFPSKRTKTEQVCSKELPTAQGRRVKERVLKERILLTVPGPCSWGIHEGTSISMNLVFLLYLTFMRTSPLKSSWTFSQHLN